jgi:hypothetical protein
MPDGHLQDPRLNSVEKDFGILLSNDMGQDGRPKMVLYLKDKVSRYLVAGTPVTFDLEERQVFYSKNNLKELVTIEIATNVRVNEEKIKSHPVIRALNACVRKILHSSRPS